MSQFNSTIWKTGHDDGLQSGAIEHLTKKQCLKVRWKRIVLDGWKRPIYALKRLFF